VRELDGEKWVVGVTDFLLELRSEEIPARMQAKARDDLARLFAEEIAKAGLTAQSIETFATPRRLALIAHGLPDQTESVSEERKGPRANAPEQALSGFLRSTNLTREQLIERDGVLFAVIDKPGRPTADVVAEVIPAIIRAFPWPKSMRWGDASLSTESLRWVRPLQGIIALFGDDVVPCDVDGIASGRVTIGHRFHHSGSVTISSAATYVEDLRAAHVIVHLSERRKLIEDGAAKAAAAAGLTVIPDEGLVLENAGLTEWPVPLLGRFDPAFLDVPREVIQLTMRTNQKYFACADAEGTLANAFVCTANINASDGGAAVIAGNEKVLSARLSDAKFFWEQDLKVKLEDQAKKLSQIVFREGLGTVADKVERVAKLARWLVEEGIIKSSPSSLGEGDHAQHGGGVGSVHPSTTSGGPPPPDKLGEDLASLAEAAARLCKADLVTGMVGEFPELQGIMGGYYARAEGLPDAVADAIRDHYKPVGQGDDVPTAPVTVAVSLADKLDTLVGYYGLAELPTGSRDPYGIRRLMLSVLSLVVTGSIRVELGEAFRKCFEIYAHAPRLSTVDTLGEKRIPLTNYFAELINGLRDGSPEEYVIFRSVTEFGQWRPDWEIHSLTQQPPLGTQLLAFEWIGEYFQSFDFIRNHLLSGFADRLKVQQREAGVRHDLIDAVFALGGEDDLVRLLARVKALQSFVGTDEGKNLLSGYKRAANILKKEQPSPSGERVDSPTASGERAGSSMPSPLPGAARLSLSPEGEGKLELSYTPEPEEDALIQALDSAEPLATAAIEREDFEGAMAALASLRAPIDAFFENVTVNDADPTKRDARLALLARVREAVHRVADFSKIEG
jgi:glycyl-tRNA synthetase beta chain